MDISRVRNQTHKWHQLCESEVHGRGVGRKHQFKNYLYMDDLQSCEMDEVAQEVSMDRKEVQGLR